MWSNSIRSACAGCASDYAAYAGRLYRDPRVRVFVAEPRAFVRASAARYDLIVLAGGDSFASGGAGVQAAASSTR